MLITLKMHRSYIRVPDKDIISYKRIGYLVGHLSFFLSKMRTIKRGFVKIRGFKHAKEHRRSLGDRHMYETSDHLYTPGSRLIYVGIMILISILLLFSRRIEKNASETEFKLAFRLEILHLSYI